MKDNEFGVRNNILLIIYPVLIIISVMLLGLGYSSANIVSKEIKDTYNIHEQDGVYITDVEYVSGIGADTTSNSINNCYKTLLKTDLILSKENTNSNITYRVYVYNKGDNDVVFKEISYNNKFYDNSEIDFRVDGIKTGDILYGKDTMAFEITFFYKSGSIPQNNALSAYLNVKFEKIKEISEGSND